MPLVLTNCRMVTPHGVVHGWLAVDGPRPPDDGSQPQGGADGPPQPGTPPWRNRRDRHDRRDRRALRILDMGALPCPHRRAVDLGGDHLLPGFVDIHTDAIERQFLPRPGVLWPAPLPAVMACDAQFAAAGITTAFDSLCAEAFPREEARRRLFGDAVTSVARGMRMGLLSVRHLLHIRCETADPKVLDLFLSCIDLPEVRLVSLMDHTPGQRQYRDLAAYRRQYQGEGWDDGEFAGVLAVLRENQQRHAAPHRAAIIAACRERSIPLASHDDTTADHVRQAAAEGIGICEFPTTLEAAREAKRCGMTTVMGAPNIVLGGSHSGNIPALDVLRADCLDILASDYAPASMAEAVFLLHREHGVPLPRCAELTATNAAKLLGLADRGSLTPGLLADFARIRLLDGAPVVLPCP